MKLGSRQSQHSLLTVCQKQGNVRRSCEDHLGILGPIQPHSKVQEIALSTEDGTRITSELGQSEDFVHFYKTVF